MPTRGSVLALGLLVLLAASSCADARCGERACGEPAAPPADPGQVRMRSEGYRIELGTDAVEPQEARSRHYRVALSIDPTRLQEAR